MKSRILLATLALLTAAAGLLIAATSPTAAPTHNNIPPPTLLGYIADYTQQGSYVTATLPTAEPVHRNIPQNTLLGYIADYTQTAANATTVIPITEYGAIPDDSTDDKAAIQAAIDATATAGGGVVYVPPGVWEVSPLATGLGILLRTNVELRLAPGSIIRGISSKATAAFCVIAPYGYNTATTPYAAHHMRITGAGKIECDAYRLPAFTAAADDIITCTAHGYEEGDLVHFRTSASDLPAGLVADTNYYVRYLTANTFSVSTTPTGDVVDITDAGTGTHRIWNNWYCHALVGFGHSPSGYLAGLTLGTVHCHRIEINKSKNIICENLTITGNGDLAEIQIDTGVLGQILNTTVTNPITEYVTLRDIRIPAQDMTNETAFTPAATRIQLGHGVADMRHITIANCQIAPKYKPAAAYESWGISIEKSSGTFVSADNITIRNNQFLGVNHGEWKAIYIAPTTSPISNLTIEGNTFGAGYDSEGLKCTGGFNTCIYAADNNATTVVSGGSVTTNYQFRRNWVFRDNVFSTRWLRGVKTMAISSPSIMMIVGPASSATIENNTFNMPCDAGTFTAGTDDVITCVTGNTYGMMPGDTIFVSNNGGTIPGGMTDETTYTVRAILTPTTFTFLAANGVDTLDITAANTGTNSWHYDNTGGAVTVASCSACLISEVQSLLVSNNTVVWNHSAALTAPAVAMAPTEYSFLLRASGLETSTLSSFWEVRNNRVQLIGTNTPTAAFWEPASGVAASPYVKGIWEGNIYTGTGSPTTNLLQGHPRWAVSGTYTPTASSATNLDSTPTPTLAQWHRNGDSITVSGSFTADPTAGGSADFELTLPVASALANAFEAAGTAYSGAIAGQGAAIMGVAANDTVQVQWLAVDTTSQAWYYTFTYQLK